MSLTQVAALRAVMADAYGVTDIPLHRPHLREPRRGYVVACRAPKTRREYLAEMPAEQRAARLEQIMAFTPGLDLDSAEVVPVELGSWIDRTGDPDLVASDYHPGTYPSWLGAAVAGMPDGYVPVGAWEVSPLDRVREAQADMAAAPGVLQAAVRAALGAGRTAPEVGEVLGVGRHRVYQLRDGTR